MKKWWFTLKNMWRYRAELKALRQPEHHLTTVTELTPEYLATLGITHLALDFDGVLAAHGYEKPLPKARSWLKTMSQALGEQAIFILSNNPDQTRATFFTNEFPGIRFISGVRKKPYPDGMHQIQDLSQVAPEKLALVDDRILTGCLACILAGSHPFLILKPTRNFKGKFFHECAFLILRVTERLLFLRKPPKK